MTATLVNTTDSLVTSTEAVSNKFSDVSTTSRRTRDDDSKTPESELKDTEQQSPASKKATAYIITYSGDIETYGEEADEELEGQEEDGEGSSDSADEFADHEDAYPISVSDIQQAFTSSAPVVDAVLLCANGDIQQIKYDGTPSLKQAKSILGSSPSIVGEFSEQGIIVIRGSSSSEEANQHSLPSPLQNENHSGNYLLFKADADGVNADFSKEEYASLVSESEANSNENDEEEEEAAGNSSAQSEQSSQSNSAYENLKQTLNGEVKDSFLAEFGREPDSSELSASVNATLSSVINSLLERQCDNEITDPTYNPEDDDSSSGTSTEDSLSDGRQELIIDEEFAAALKHISSLGRRDGKALVDSIANTFVETNGAEPSLDQLSAIFSRIKDNFQFEAEQDMQESVVLSAYVADNEGQNVDIDAFQQEFDEALQSVCALGLQHGSEFANFVADEFSLINGREPELEELQSIFSRITGQLAEEAEDEEADNESDEENEELEDENDDDYNPNNSEDEQLAECDDADDLAFEADSDFVSSEAEDA